MMKTLFLLVISMTFPVLSWAQLSISHPMSKAVYQRNSSGSATITIAGQYLGSMAGSYQIEYKLDKLNISDGSYNSNINNWTSIVSNPSFGMFMTSISVSTGWYSVSVRAYNTSTSSTITSNSARFGVGDVYLIAGQSNAQGIDGSWSLPSVTPNDAVVSNNLLDGCNQDLPPYPSMSTLGTTDRVATTGYSGWCWVHLGKELSDNDGAPVAFFNAAYSGTTVENWATSAGGNATNNLYGGGQYCGTGYTGQPYKTFKNIAAFHVGLFGVKAGLWHQGEADNDVAYSNVTNASDYESRLTGFLNQTRSDITSNFSWLISRASFNGNNSPGNETNSGVISGQNNTISNASYTYEGPSTDDMDASYRDVSDKVHFREDRNGALTELGNRWKTKILAAGYSRLAANSPPAVTVTKLSGTFYLTAPSSQSEYRWVNASSLNINSVISSNQTLAVSGGSAYACYVRNGNKWSLTQTIYTSCGVCREANQQWTENEIGIDLKQYPNPTTGSFTINFTIPDDNQVRLEVLKLDGGVLQSVVDAFHTKGTYQYPVQLKNFATGMYIYRLTVGGLAITKKLIKID